MPKVDLSGIQVDPTGKIINTNINKKEQKTKTNKTGNGFFSTVANRYKSLYSAIGGPVADILGTFNPVILSAREAQKDYKAIKSGETRGLSDRRVPFSPPKIDPKTAIEVGKGVGKEVLDIAQTGEKILQAPLKMAGQDFRGETGVSGLEKSFGLEEGQLTTPSNTAQSVGKLGAEIGTFFLPGGATRSAGVKISKLPSIASKGKGVVSAAKVAPSVVSDTLITALQTEGDLKQTGIAAALPFAFGGVMRGAGATSRAISNRVAPKIKSSLSKLEETANITGIDLAEKGTDNVFQTLVDDIAFEPTVKQATARFALRRISDLKGLQQNWVNRFASIDRLDNEFEKVIGRKLDVDEKLGVRAALTEPIIQQRAAQMTDDVTSLVDGLERVSPEFSKVAGGYLLKLDELNRIKGGKITSKGRSLEEVEQIIKKSQESFTPEQAEAVEKARAYIQSKNMKLLNDSVESGLLDQDTVRRLVQANPDYIPHEVVLDAVEKAYDDVASVTGRGSFSNSKKIIQEAKGSERSLKDPFQAVITRFNAMEEAIQKNKTVRSMIERVEQNASAFPEFKAIDTAVQKQGRVALMQALGEATAEQKQALKLLRSNTKYSKQVKREIQDTINKINQQEDELRRMAEAFFADEKLIGKPGKSRFIIKKLPNELIPRAESIRNNFKTYDDFLSSNTARAVERDVMSGKMEVLGFPGDEDKVLRDFFEASMGESRFTQPTAKGKVIKAKDLGDQQKKTLALIEGLQRNVDINNTSADEAVSFANRLLKEVKEAKQSIHSGINELKALSISEPRKKELGVGTINFFREGIKETWLIPRDVEIATKNLNSEQIGKIFRTLTAPNRVMRSFATGKNPSFFLPNVARDVQTGLLTAEDGLAVDAFAQGLFRSNPELLAQAAADGAFFGASVYKIDDPFVKKGTQELQKSGLMKTVKNAASLDMIENVAESLENATRFSAYTRALRNGASRVEAANISRNVTVDFNRMGQMMKPLNQLIPFLNARVQGVINIGKAAKNNPERFARMQYLTAVMPATELYQHNRGFDTYQNIPPYITNNFWVYMIDEVEGVDEDGNNVMYPQFISIPKGEGQKLVSNPIEFLMKRADGINSQQFSEVMMDNALSITPLTFQSLRAEDLASGVLSSFGPVPRIAVGAATNIDPFTGLPIVPTSRTEADPEFQFSDRTPEITKSIGKEIGVSPAKLQFGLESLFAGIGKDVPSMIDTTVSGEIDSGLSGTDFGKVTKTPLLRSFARESTDYYNPENARLREIISDIKTGSANEKVVSQEVSRQVKERLIEIPEEQRERELVGMVRDGAITKSEAKSIASDIKNNLTPTERQLKSLGVENFGRAMALYQYLQVLPDEDHRSYLKSLKDKKILTEKVYGQLKLLDRNEGEVPL